MEPLSLKQIFLAILGILVLIHRKEILGVLEPIGSWFHDSLLGLYDFPRGAQTAIAFLTLVLIVVLIVKHFRK